ncbi:uncharacterized protein V6R79_017671 [Siganus canaliculatus]
MTPKSASERSPVLLPTWVFSRRIRDLSTPPWAGHTRTRRGWTRALRGYMPGGGRRLEARRWTIRDLVWRTDRRTDGGQRQPAAKSDESGSDSICCCEQPQEAAQRPLAAPSGSAAANSGSAFTET